jgi:acyl-CoA reductase-like NAD-dependent aldehyde dehydrogenase
MHDRLIIGGDRVSGAGERFDIVDPSSASVAATVAAASSGQVAEAVAAARGAFPGWHAATPSAC